MLFSESCGADLCPPLIDARRAFVSAAFDTTLGAQEARIDWKAFLGVFAT